MAGKFDESLATGTPKSMEYHLVSSVQKENGPRLLWPHFGLFYKAIATKISVYFYDLATSTKVKIIDVDSGGIVNSIGNSISKEMEWKYLSKNLSTLTQFTDMWSANTEKLWQVARQPNFVKIEYNLMAYCLSTNIEIIVTNVIF